MAIRGDLRPHRENVSNPIPILNLTVIDGGPSWNRVPQPVADEVSGGYPIGGYDRGFPSFFTAPDGYVGKVEDVHGMPLLAVREEISP